MLHSSVAQRVPASFKRSQMKGACIFSDCIITGKSRPFKVLDMLENVMTRNSHQNNLHILEGILVM